MALGDEVTLPKLTNRVDRHAVEEVEVRSDELPSEANVLYIEPPKEEEEPKVASLEPVSSLPSLWSVGSQLGISSVAVLREEGLVGKQPRPEQLRGSEGVMGRGGPWLGGRLLLRDSTPRSPSSMSWVSETGSLAEQGRSSFLFPGVKEQKDEEDWGEFPEDIFTPPLQEDCRSKDKKPISDMERFIGKLTELGINKVAFSGLRNGQLGTTRLPERLLAQIEGAELLFIRCSEDGGVLATSNFYLARACGMQIYNALFLREWASNNYLPDLWDFRVFSSCKTGDGTPHRLQPLDRMLFERRFFCVLSTDPSSVVVRQLVKKLGGRLVPMEERNRVQDVVYTLSGGAVLGENVYHQDWVLDSVELGYVPKKERFLLQPMDDGLCSQVSQ